MKCRALYDGLIAKSRYIHAGEEFEADKCPSWAVRVNPPAPKKEATKPVASTEKDGE